MISIGSIHSLLGPRSLKNRRTSPIDSPQHLGRSPSLPRRLTPGDEDDNAAAGPDASALSPRLQEVHEQLQVHIQTIGILVSEKTDLQVQLQQSTTALNKKRDDLVSSLRKALWDAVNNLTYDYSICLCTCYHAFAFLHRLYPSKNSFFFVVTGDN